MLTDFFRLNGQFDTLDEARLVDHFRRSRDLRSALYKPDGWPPTLKKNKNVTFNNVSLAKTDFYEVTFTDCTFEDCLFIGSNFDKVEFHRCQFKNCNFYKVTFDNCYVDPTTFVFDKQYRNSYANIGVHLYQQLYENASATRQSTFAMTADIEFRRWKRWQLAYDAKQGKITPTDKNITAVASIVYECLTGFGYRPLRFICSTVALFALMSLLNYFALSDSLKVDGKVVTDLSLIDSVFYTFSMMTVLGFSFIVPNTGVAKLLTVSEALVGIGWLGIFTSLLVKRFIK